MFIGGVVDFWVSHHAQSALLTAMSELDEIAKGAVAEGRRRSSLRHRSRVILTLETVTRAALGRSP